MRRDPCEIMEKILRIMEQEHEALSVNQLAKKTGFHNLTVKRYVRMIEMVMEEPGVEVIKTRHSILIRIEKNKG